MQISVIDAILGAVKEIITIEGIKKTVTIPQGTQPNQKIILKSEGFYMLNSNSRGDHIFTVKISVPKDLSDEQRSLYQKLR